jgi:hypothetical protein
MPRKDIVVIGASAGGIDALRQIVSALPHDLPATLLVVLHTTPYSPGILPEILGRAGPLPASNARDWEPFEPGRIYVAPAEEEGVYPVSKEMETEVKIAREDNALESGIFEWGEPSLYACPECHGVLLQLKEGRNVRFRCHTGHAYSVDTLLAEFSERTEETLWSAVRSIEEGIILMRNMASHMSEHDRDAAEALLREAQDAQRRAEIVRRALMSQEKLSAEKVGAAAGSDEP